MAVIQFDKVLETDLNPEQRRAVESIHGPVLVLAGAGSGKTRVIAYRAANLIFTKTCKPWQILGVTFTNKAAEEMRNRVHKLVGIEGHEVPLGTFHRTCSQILRKFGGEIGVPTEFQIFAPYAAGRPIFEFGFELLPAVPGDDVPLEIVSVHDWNDVALPVGRWGPAYAATRLTFDRLPVTGHVCTVALRATGSIVSGSSTTVFLTLTAVSLPPRRVDRMETRRVLGWN